MSEAYFEWFDQLQSKILFTWLRNSHLLLNIQIFEKHRQQDLHAIVRELWNMYSAEKQQSFVVFENIMNDVIKTRRRRD